MSTPAITDAQIDAHIAVNYSGSDWADITREQWRNIARGFLALAPVAGGVPAGEAVTDERIRRLFVEHGHMYAGWLELGRAILALAHPAAQPATSMRCEDCNGTGEVGDEIPQGEFQPPERDRCDSCDGTGRWKLDAAQPASSSAPAVGGDEPTEAMVNAMVRRIVLTKSDGAPWEDVIRLAYMDARALAAPAGAAGQDAAWLSMLAKLPSLDPSWPEPVKDGWMRCFNALRALAAQGDGGTTE